MDVLKWQESAQGITFSVKVVPRARCDELVGVDGDELKVRLHAPPAEGKANAALVKFFAAMFGVKRADVQILQGESSRHKLVRVQGATGEKLRKLVSSVAPCASAASKPAKRA